MADCGMCRLSLWGAAFCDAAPRFLHSVGQFEGDEFAGVVAAADGENDVLLAVDHVGHRRTALRSGHEDFSDFLTCRFVVGTKLGAAEAVCVGCVACLTGDDEGFGCQDAYDAGAASL